MLKCSKSHEFVFCFDNSIQGVTSELAAHAGNHCPNLVSHLSCKERSGAARSGPDSFGVKTSEAQSWTQLFTVLQSRAPGPSAWRWELLHLPGTTGPPWPRKWLQSAGPMHPPFTSWAFGTEVQRSCLRRGLLCGMPLCQSLGKTCKKPTISTCAE